MFWMGAAWIIYEFQSLVREKLIRSSAFLDGLSCNLQFQSPRWEEADSARQGFGGVGGDVLVSIPSLGRSRFGHQPRRDLDV